MTSPAQECGCKIVGRLTRISEEPRTWIFWCPLHAAAGEMLNCLKASLEMTVELSRTMDDNHWYRSDLRELAGRLEKSISRAEVKV